MVSVRNLVGRIVAILLIALVLAGCCRTCRQPAAAPPVAAVSINDVPAPYRLSYQVWPTRYIPEVVVIQGGREFVLQPEIPEEVGSR